MTPRENAMAIFYGRQPDYYGDIMEAITLVPDPVMFGDIPPRDGKEYRDSWGTVYIWPPDAPGPHPRVTKENAVIPDIEHWQDYLKVPSLEGLDFGPAKQVAESVDRKEKFVGFMFGGGLFERSHHLMGMQDALMNYLEYPEEMAGVLREICEYKKAYIRLMAREVHPDIIFYHDDWGSKQNLFLPPRTWRALIKPLQQEISDTIHECGMIYMHHADCICQPIPLCRIWWKSAWTSGRGSSPRTTLWKSSALPKENWQCAEESTDRKLTWRILPRSRFAPRYGGQLTPIAPADGSIPPYPTESASGSGTIRSSWTSCTATAPNTPKPIPFYLKKLRVREIQCR